MKVVIGDEEMNAAAWLTVRVKLCVASGGDPLVAVMVRGRSRQCPRPGCRPGWRCRCRCR